MYLREVLLLLSVAAGDPTLHRRFVLLPGLPGSLRDACGGIRATASHLANLHRNRQRAAVNQAHQCVLADRRVHFQAITAG